MTHFQTALEALNQFEASGQVLSETFYDKLSPLCKILGYSSLQKISSIYIEEDDFCIIHSWAFRGYSNDEHVRIPLDILKDKNPLKAAKIFVLSAQIHAAEYEIASAVSLISSKKQELELLTENLKQLSKET